MSTPRTNEDRGEYVLSKLDDIIADVPLVDAIDITMFVIEQAQERLEAMRCGAEK